MIICPRCGRPMKYREGENRRGHYEFYGCSTYPRCTQIVEMEDACKYDDGKKPTIPERTLEEEGEDIRDILLSDGWSWNDANYAGHMWEKD